MNMDDKSKKLSILTQPIQIFEKPMEPSKDEFAKLRDFIYESCGIALGGDKLYLVTQRLGPLAKKSGCSNFTEFHKRLKEDGQSAASLRERVVEAITTNETSFFRDIHPFEAFKDSILNEMAARLRLARAKEPSLLHRIKIWCAASSTGQEPYSMAILIMERLIEGAFPDLNPHDFKILATDISGEVLAQAQKGSYNQTEMSRGLTEEAKARYFTHSGGRWTVISPVRQMVEFRQVNLIKPFAAIGSFDMISCRNVLIYFDDKTKSRILDSFHDMLAPGGCLLLGAMENTYCLSSKFVSRRIGKTIIYDRKK